MTTPAKKQVADVCLELLHNEMIEYILTDAKYVGKPEKAYLAVEDMGFKVGIRLAERWSKERARFSENLDVMKFICKEFWTDLFKKQIDNLRTNHRGTYVLVDNKFRWLTKLSQDNMEATLQSSQHYVTFTCGMIRGCLSALGVETIVTGEIPKTPFASCIFRIQERT